MRRKKVSDDVDVIEGIPDLGDDEQLVSEVTTKRTVRKERMPPIEKEAPEIEILDEDPIGSEIEPGYSPNSLAALIFDSDEEPLANQFCTVAVRRNPDGMNDRFSTPCTSVLHFPRMINIELAADRADIEDRVRSEYGGGHYFFQIHYNNRLASSWKATLADLPAHLRGLKPETEPAPPAVSASPEPINPFDQFFDTLRKQKEMKELLFGDEQKRFETEIERLKAEAAKEPPRPPEPRSEKLVLLEHALQAGNPTLQDRLLSHLFPEPEESSSHWIVDLVKTGFEHKEELAGIAQMVLGSYLPQPKPQGIEALLRQQPPASNVDTVPRSTFQRKRIAQADQESVEKEIEQNDPTNETVN